MLPSPFLKYYKAFTKKPDKNGAIRCREDGKPVKCDDYDDSGKRTSGVEKPKKEPKPKVEKPKPPSKPNKETKPKAEKKPKKEIKPKLPTKPKKEPKPKAPKLTLDEAKVTIDALKINGKVPNEKLDGIIDVLSKLTVPELKKFKAEVGGKGKEIKKADVLKVIKDRLGAEDVPVSKESRFTGTDSLGRKWVDGKLVSAGMEQGTEGVREYREALAKILKLGDVEGSPRFEVGDNAASDSNMIRVTNRDFTNYKSAMEKDPSQWTKDETQAVKTVNHETVHTLSKGKGYDSFKPSEAQFKTTSRNVPSSADDRKMVKAGVGLFLEEAIVEVLARAATGAMRKKEWNYKQDSGAYQQYVIGLESLAKAAGESTAELASEFIKMDMRERLVATGKIVGGANDEEALQLGNEYITEVLSQGNGFPPKKKEFDDTLKEIKANKLVPKPPEPGFTGIDSLGREWRNGELVAKPTSELVAKPTSEWTTPDQGSQAVEEALQKFDDPDAWSKAYTTIHKMKVPDLKELATKLGFKFPENISRGSLAKSIIAALQDQVRKQRELPKPPQPGFTGIDSLGRKWVNGVLVPGEEEIPVNKTFKTLNLNANKVGLKLPELDKETAAVFESIVTFDGYTKYDDPLAMHTDITLDSVDDPAKVEALLKYGLVTGDVKWGMMRSPQITPKGILYFALQKWGKTVKDLENLPVPTTKADINLWSMLYPTLNPEGRKEIIENFGLEGLDPDADYAKARKEFRDITTSSANAAKNGDIAKSVRADKESQLLVNKLSQLSIKSENELKEEENKAWDNYLALSEQSSEAFDIGDYAKMDELSKAADESKEKHDKLTKMKEAANADRKKVIVNLIGLPKDKVIDPIGINLAKLSEEERKTNIENLEGAAEFLSRIVAKGSKGESMPNYNMELSEARAHYDGGYNLVNVGIGTDEGVMIHEMVHGIEQKMPGCAAACKAFVEYRCQDDKFVKMRDKFPELKNYDADEEGRKDNFDLAMPTLNHAYYCGKVYDGSTELLTMGVEQLYRDPSGFARKDPEYCAFIVGILQGRLRFEEID